MNEDESRLTVAGLGERALIERVTSLFGPAPAHEVWSGDDTAVLEAPQEALLFTTDLMVEDVDFRRSYASGFDVGWKLVAINASDVASMGGRPWRAVANLSLPEDTEVAFVDDLAEGIVAACSEWDIGLVGGDFSAGREISASLAMIGLADGEQRVLRNGANPGHILCVTGALGGSAGGLVVLEEGIDDGPSRDSLVSRHLRPRARVREGFALAGLASAMIDVSDGLAVDLGHLTAASHVGCEVTVEALPLDDGLRWLGSVHPDTDPGGLALLGGEDFELLLTLDGGNWDEARARVEAVGTSLSRIGTITDGPARIGGRDLEKWRAEGWEHLRSR
ncbi:MAG: thiamine-phosphate kinase [Actinobacteria bacterium]|nr:thiamine-phosphate kinase [Actinomycetota bacterium]